MLTLAGHSSVQVPLSHWDTVTDETCVVPASLRRCPVKGRGAEMVPSVHSEMSWMGWREAREFKVQNLPLRWLRPPNIAVWDLTSMPGPRLPGTLQLGKGV